MKMAMETGVETAATETDLNTNWWNVTNKAGNTVHHVFGETEEIAREHATRSYTVRRLKTREGDFGLSPMTAEEFNAWKASDDFA